MFQACPVYVRPAPSHLDLQSRLTKLSIWFPFIWLQNLTESCAEDFSFQRSNSSRRLQLTLKFLGHRAQVRETCTPCKLSWMVSQFYQSLAAQHTMAGGQATFVNILADSTLWP